MLKNFCLIGALCFVASCASVSPGKPPPPSASPPGLTPPVGCTLPGPCHPAGPNPDYVPSIPTGSAVSSTDGPSIDASRYAELNQRFGLKGSWSAVKGLGGLRPALPMAQIQQEACKDEDKMSTGAGVLIAGDECLYLAVQKGEGDFELLRNQKDFRRVFAPVETPEEALAFVHAQSPNSESSVAGRANRALLVNGVFQLAIYVDRCSINEVFTNVNPDGQISDTQVQTVVYDDPNTICE